jgi:hypothetical protein
MFLADYNLDGKIDAAVPNSNGSPGGISVFPGTGIGSFGAAVNYFFSVNNNPMALCSGDFNSDGSPDLAVSHANTNDVSILLNGIPTLTFSSQNSVCSGNSISITASGASTYTWTGGAFTNSISVSPATNTSYTVTGRSYGGCMNRAVKSITVNPNPTITVNNGITCAGQNFTLTPSGGISYTYSGGSAVVSPTSVTNYTVTGSNSEGCEAMAVSNIAVNLLPNITISAANTVICQGEEIVLNAVGANSYTWSTGSNANSIVVNPATNTTYSLTGSDANNCENSSSFVLQVDACLGISQLAEGSIKWAVYPNPNIGEFFIETSQAVDVSIYNTMGQLILQQKVSEGKNQINLHEQANGIYFIEINQNAEIKRMKLIKE